MNIQGVASCQTWVELELYLENNSYNNYHYNLDVYLVKLLLPIFMNCAAIKIYNH